MRFVASLFMLLMGWSSWAPGAGAQQELAIRHRPFDCFPSSRFPMIRAEIDSLSDIQSARVYFHSDRFPDIYYVEMSPAEDGFEAVLPMPGVDTRRILYYIEVVDARFNSTRTEEYNPAVDEGCQDDPTAVFPGDNPGIIIGALEAGAAAIPPGFQAAGIAGLVSAAGGIGATTAVVVAAGAAAGAAGAVAASGGGKDNTSTTTTSGIVNTTSSPGPTTTVGPTTTANPSTTTTPPGPSSSTTTGVPTPSTTTSIPVPQACFETKTLNFCRVKFDAQCSVGEIIAYMWEIDTEGLVGGPFTRVTPAEVYNHDFETCNGETIQVQLTISDVEGRSDRTTQSVQLPTSESPPLRSAELQASATSYLQVPGPVRGSVVFNDDHRDMTVASAEIRHHYRGRHGENKIEAILETGATGEGLWRFDFSGSPSFEAGSIEVVLGQPTNVTGYGVVFRLRGIDGERIGFVYRLREERIW